MAKRLRAWKAEYLVLTRPLGPAIAETGNSKSARQATFDGRFDQIGYLSPFFFSPILFGLALHCWREQVSRLQIRTSTR